MQTINITGYGSKGEGVARLDDGRVVFVRGAARGDICRVAVTSESPRSCRAEICEIIEPSPYRIEPDCTAYPMCGGCDFRHIVYEEELRAKLWRVNDALRRIGSTEVCADEIISTGRVNGYRNKAVFHTERRGKESLTGFYRAGTNEICPIRHCLLLPEVLNDELSQLWSNPTAENPAMYRVGSCAGFGSNVHAPVVIELDGLVYRISHTSFFQVNNGAALSLFQKAREYAAMSNTESLVDLYCGVGSLTLFIGRDAGFSLGVENNLGAVDDALENLQRNNLSRIEILYADSAVWDSGSIRPDCIVVDPPRRGLSSGAVRKILELSPSRIVYISCDPATLARDIRLLAGYDVQQVCVIDMFPRTANVECCVRMIRKV